jgi:hypothetical protein
MRISDELDRKMREARLVLSRPEVVFEELKAYGAEIATDPLLYSVDDKLEASLAARNEPLIDLGLACYGSNKDIVGALYRKALGPSDALPAIRYCKALRIACLSNRSVPVVHSIAAVFDKYPDLVIGSDETHRVLAEGDEDEADALICNPHVSDSLLQALYECGDPFKKFDKEHWRRLVLMSINNRRLVTRNDTEDGPDLGHGHIQEAIFKLLELAPTTDTWLRSLYRLLDSLDPQYVAWPESIDAVLDRWSAVTVDDYKGNPSEGYVTSASLRDEFRCMIGALYSRGFRGKEIVRFGSPSASDLALRCAYYARAELTANDMQEAYARDRDVFTFAVLFNDHVYLTPTLRQGLEENYLNSTLDWRYRRRCQQLHKRYRKFNPQPAAEWLVDDEGEDQNSKFKGLAERLAVIETKAVDLGKQIQTVRRLLLWGFLIIGAVIFFLRR